MRSLLLVLLLGGCDVGPTAPYSDECREFNHRVKREGRWLSCRMLWCSHTGGAFERDGTGMATLWCDANLNLLEEDGGAR